MNRSLIFNSGIRQFFDNEDTGGGNADGGGNNAGGPITFKSQEDFDKVIQRRLDRHEEAVKTKYRDELKNELKTELEGEQNAEEAKEQGKFKELYEAEQAKVLKLEDKIKEMKDEIAENEKAQLRRTIAAKHKLPDEIADRLKGDTEEEITADAKDLAKKLNVKVVEESEEQGKRAGPPSRRGSDTDVGKGNRPLRPTGERESGEQSTAKPGQYAFTKEGDVSWG